MSGNPKNKISTHLKIKEIGQTLARFLQTTKSRKIDKNDTLKNNDKCIKSSFRKSPVNDISPLIKTNKK